MKTKRKSNTKNGGFQAVWLILAQGATLPLLTLLAPRFTFLPAIVVLCASITMLHIASNKISLIDSEPNMDYENIIENTVARISLPKTSLKKATGPKVANSKPASTAFALSQSI